MMTNMIAAAILAATNSLGSASIAEATNSLWLTNPPWVTNTTAWSCYVDRPAEVRLQAGGTLSDISESVATVTNVVVADNGKAGCPYPGGCLVIGCDHSPSVPATERTETTTVTEATTLRFKWNGVACEQKRERVVSRKVRKWAKRDEWREVE